jgi:hypothetical protein
MPETAAPSARPYVLGIDLGSASIGWAVVELDATGAPTGMLSDRGNSSSSSPSCGVRIFEPAVSGDIEKGQDNVNFFGCSSDTACCPSIREWTEMDRSSVMLS